MANRYYTEFSKRKITAPKGPEPGTTGQQNLDIGARRPSPNKVGFKEVKDATKSDH